MDRAEDLRRIREGLDAAAQAIRPFEPGKTSFRIKEQRGDPVTEADRAADHVLRALLPRDGEGWLSEESADDPERLGCARVWVVDPIDGTREFVDGIPEWCISIGLVEDEIPVAGGILNPATGEVMLGAEGLGVTYNGVPCSVVDGGGLEGARVLASRSETARGEWSRFGEAPFSIDPCGSVAYKMALVAAGRAHATWTLVPKSEWDVAAGTALVRAAGGRVALADGSQPRFNRARPVLPNLLAAGEATALVLLRDWISGAP